MSWLELAVAELRRAPGRFGRLVAAVAVLTMLVVAQQALLAGLVAEMNGGLRTADADLYVMAATADGAMPASTVPESAVGVAESVPGVAAAGALRLGGAAVVAGGRRTDVTLVGVDAGGPGAPARLRAGRPLSGDGQAIVSGAQLPGGGALTVVPGDRIVRVVGAADDASLGVAPTLFVPTATFIDLVRSQRPDALTPPPRTAVAVRVDRGHDVAAVATDLAAAIDGTQVLTRAEAAAGFPGVAEVTHSFDLVLLLLGGIVALVAGLFFLVHTAQKAPVLTLLRASGVGAAALVSGLLVQVVVVVGVGIAAGAALAAGVLAVVDVGIEATVDPAATMVTAGAITALVLLACLAAVRRVLRVDPAGALA